MATISKLQRASGTVYKARVRRAGQNGQISKTFPTRTAAERWARKIEGAIVDDNAGLTSEGQKHTLRETVAQYRVDKLPKLRPSTARAYEDHLEYWESSLGHLRLSEITPARIADHRDRLQEGRAPATVSRYLATLASVLTFAKKSKHWLKDSPMDAVEKPIVSNGKTRFLSQDELKRLLEACKSSESPDLYLAVLISITTGARQGEVFGLRWCDVDLVGGALFLRADNQTRTKGGVRRVGIASQVRPLLEERLDALKLKCKGADGDEKDMPERGLVFPSRISTKQPVDLRTPFWTALRRAGIENFRWHDLRHSAASFMAANGASLLEIGTVLGHKSSNTTKRYAHLTEQATDILVQNTADKVLGGTS